MENLRAINKLNFTFARNCLSFCRGLHAVFDSSKLNADGGVEKIYFFLVENKIVTKFNYSQHLRFGLKPKTAALEKVLVNVL